MARIGYARVSSTDQNLERQVAKLKEVKCDKIFQEKISGASMNRPELQKMLNCIRDDDTVVVTELDRLSRNRDDLTKILQFIYDKEAEFECLNLPSLAGVQDKNIRMLLNNIILEIFKYIAEEERRKFRELQRQGIALAKAAGKYKGRKRLFPNTQSPRLQLALEKYLEGMSYRGIQELTGIAPATFSRYRRELGISRKEKNDD